MGVDVSLFVLEDPWGGHTAQVEHVLRLQRNSDLWGPLERCVDQHKHHRWEAVQLPHGSWSTGPDGPPEGFEGGNGYLFKDSDDGDLWAIKGRHLAEVKQEDPGEWPGWDDSFNQAVFAFVVEHFPDHDVIVFWS